VTGGLDLLVIMAHPDDAELLCGGAIIKSASAGKRVGVLDLTAGEMGSSGSVSSAPGKPLKRARSWGSWSDGMPGFPMRRSRTTTNPATS